VVTFGDHVLKINKPNEFASMNRMQN
jgi:hypothetical protein